MLTDDGEESGEEGEEGGAPCETKERCHECVICSVSSKVRSVHHSHAAGECFQGAFPSKVSRPSVHCQSDDPTDSRCHWSLTRDSTCFLLGLLQVSSDNPMGLVSLVQRSRLMASSHHKAMQGMGLSAGADSLDDAEEGAENIGSFPDLNHGVNLHFQSCGHHIHLSCFGSYFKSLLQVPVSLFPHLSSSFSLVSLSGFFRLFFLAFFPDSPPQSPHIFTCHSHSFPIRSRNLPTLPRTNDTTETPTESSSE
jgi:hypothetical protein